MRFVTILGTRPELIRLSLLIAKLDQLADRHVLMHTGQNFTPDLSGNFFTELGIRAPDVRLDARKTTIGGQLAVMFQAAEELLQREKPDKVLVLGDTNSALCALIAERMGIPVVHMEAGNRCWDLSVPEEKNRRVIDAVSTFNLPYTENSRQNLLREGFPASRIFKCGNPIFEVLQHYAPQISASRVLEQLGLEPRRYMLATVHRAENVDRPRTLVSILNGFRLAAEETGLRIICSVHPRTRARMRDLGLGEIHPLIEFYEPFGFFDFVSLEKQALCVLTDSGTVQEECCILGVPAVTVRRSTERPETVDCGSNIVSGCAPEAIRGAVRVMAQSPRKWHCPDGYLEENVSDKVVKFMFGGTGDV
jgi:UDP-N-acetylglucosamine 2-epimerase (non-hydrolysing)